MRFEAYTSDLANRHSIRDFEAAQMSYFYNGVGKFSLYLDANRYNVDAIEQEGILYEPDKNIPYTIQHVKHDTVQNQIVVNGYTTNWLLNKRAITAKKALKKVEADLYSAVTANLRNLPRVSVAQTKGLPAVTDATLFGGQLLDKTMEILATVGYGNRMRWSDKTRSHTFEIYQGRDLTPAVAGKHALVFSTVRGTAQDLVASCDSSTFKNYFYVVGKKSDGTEEIIEYGDAAPADRRECWLTGTITQKKDEPHADFVKRAKQKCKEEAGKRLKRQNFSVKINSDDFGTKYNLGDKVACVSEPLNISFEARIEGITISLDSSGYNSEIKLGEPTLTSLEEVLLR